MKLLKWEKNAEGGVTLGSSPKYSTADSYASCPAQERKEEVKAQTLRRNDKSISFMAEPVS